MTTDSRRCAALSIVGRVMRQEYFPVEKATKFGEAVRTVEAINESGLGCLMRCHRDLHAQVWTETLGTLRGRIKATCYWAAILSQRSANTECSSFAMAREMLHRLESRDIQGRTKIRTAAESRLDTFDLHILIGLGVNIEARCNMEWTPLMAAVRVGTPKGVEALLNAGANIKASDLSKRTVLVAAIRSHSSENIELLLKHTTDPDERVAAFCEAATGGQAELTRMIYQPGMSISPSLLPYATSRGFHQIVFPLLEWRADVNGKDYQGRTALEWAIRNRDATLQKALVAAGADTRGKSLEEFAHWVRVRSLDQL